MSTRFKIVSAALALVSALLLLIAACRKTAEMPGYLTVRLTDVPAAYSEVNIEVKGLEVHYDKRLVGNDGWVAVKTKTGVYDLLALKRGASVVLADRSALPPGSITQLRLLLARQNSVITASSAWLLLIPGEENTGIKLNVNGNISPLKTMEIVLDFNAEASIHYNDKGYYELTPVIKVAGVAAM